MGCTRESFLADVRPRIRTNKRAMREVEFLRVARASGYDREACIAFCMAGPGGSFLGREVFEQSYDDGSMILMAQWYEVASK
jgi:hypothetical protein